jgi:cell division protein FtsW (lipid II flippase)
MSHGTYVEALERKKVMSALLVFVICAGLLFWHGPSFPLAVITVCAALYLVTTALALHRLRRDRQWLAKK